MTKEEKEEAIEVLKDMIEYGWGFSDYEKSKSITACEMGIEALKQEPAIRHCNDCKKWKDSDGVYRRGIGAESKCPINSREVFEGNGYCYMFEPQEREDIK